VRKNWGGFVFLRRMRGVCKNTGVRDTSLFETVKKTLGGWGVGQKNTGKDSGLTPTLFNKTPALEEKYFGKVISTNKKTALPGPR